MAPNLLKMRSYSSHVICMRKFVLTKFSNSISMCDANGKNNKDEKVE